MEIFTYLMLCRNLIVKLPMPAVSSPRLAIYFYAAHSLIGAWDGVVVKALRYYSDGPGIDSRWCHWIFQ
jgi:hypothetical protein